MVAGVSTPDPFILNDAIAIVQGVLRYQKTAGLSVRSQAFNPALKTLCLIAAGQSNYTTLVPSAYIPSSSSVVDQMNVCDGGSYEINGPILGTQYNPVAFPGNLGNMVPRIAQAAITGGFDRVVMMNIAIGGSTADDWATGSLSTCIPVAMRRLMSRGYVPGATGLTFAITWGQGETAGAGAYGTMMATTLANAQAAGFSGSSCRFFINKQTWNAGSVNATIQTAQTAFVNGTTVFAGGDLDSLDATNRQADNTHFNDTGAAAAATLIWNAMHATGAPF